MVVFPDRRFARRAITISRKFAGLCQSQGKIVNTDFLPDDAKHVKIRKANIV